MTHGSPLDAHAASPAEVAERLRAQRAGHPFLVLRDGDDRQRLVLLTPGTDRLTIGRRSACEVALPWDERVSRAHALLERLGDEWAISDDGLSRNGTFVNGEQVRAPRVLRDGDVVKIGGTAIAFCTAGISTSAAATAEGSAVIAPSTLTPAQRNVLVALCRPLLDDGAAAPASNQEIADELVLGVETVKSHLKALFDRFALGDLPASAKRVELARGAVRLGLVSRRDLGT